MNTRKKIVRFNDQCIDFVSTFYSDHFNEGLLMEIPACILIEIFSISQDIDINLSTDILLHVGTNNKNTTERIVWKSKVANSSIYACEIYLYLGSDREWAENVIENAVSGDPSSAAYNIADTCKEMKRWAENVIKDSKIGKPSKAAYMMFLNLESSRNWTESVIENDKTGSATFYAYWMTKHCGSSREWAERIIENSKIGDPFNTAWMMVKHCGSSQGWYKKVTGKDYE